MVVQIVVSMWNLLLNVLLVYENSIMDKDISSKLSLRQRVHRKKIDFSNKLFNIIKQFIII